MIRIVVMGVAGSGKTTVGSALADHLDAVYVDADDVHPAANIEKMAAGIPLTDADRRPWLDALRDDLSSRRSVVMSCSSLKRSYRDRLRRAGQLRFVHLDVDREVLEARLRSRSDHFMSAAMLDGQLATLEPPSPDEVDVTTVRVTSAGRSPESVLAEVVVALDLDEGNRPS